MTRPDPDVAALPPALRAVLDAELRAGNEIVEIGHSFPAPPIGATFKLARPISTRPRDADDGLVFTAHESSLCSGDLTDADRRFFLLDPPLPERPEPTMDEVREARRRAYAASDERLSAPLSPRVPSPPPAVSPAPPPQRLRSEPSSALGRFEASMQIDYEKWHDGIGYDLDALAEATPAEREAIAKALAARRPRDWRDVEALAALGSPDLVPELDRTASLVSALEETSLYGGLSQAIDEAAEFHPPKVIEALFKGALKREGEAAVHFAALLLFIHGKAETPFDDDKRPFFLRFATPAEDPRRREAFRELCERVGADAGTPK